MSTPCHFQRPVFVGSTSTSIWRACRYAARPPNIRFVKKLGPAENASKIHSLSNDFMRGSLALYSPANSAPTGAPGGLDGVQPAISHRSGTSALSRRLLVRPDHVPVRRQRNGCDRGT